MVKIFLSYCREDENFARQFAYNLRRLGASIWIDVEAIRAGSKWSRE
ncbi:MAG: toll/interleukin-1 receptor domain-containing protein, partial [Anaerolineae bacterium]|nr:toll/interleukin-1 receptor domain-containing protein [Anaerolineae bacterium]